MIIYLSIRLDLMYLFYTKMPHVQILSLRPSNTKGFETQVLLFSRLSEDKSYKTTRKLKQVKDGLTFTEKLHIIIA